MSQTNLTEKICIKCGKLRLLKDFYKHKKSKDGHQSWCKTCYKVYDKERHAKNQERITQKRKVWLKHNRLKVRKREAEYRRKRQLQDPCFKLLLNLRSRINIALCRNSKVGSTLDLLGCSIQELKSHLESQFKPGMTWDNHTVQGWHIDHIIPCSKFDLTNPDDQRECFHYTNLQPLWSKENLVKSNG